MAIQKQLIGLTVAICSIVLLSACSTRGGDPLRVENSFYAGVGGLVSQVEPKADHVPDVRLDETQSSGIGAAIGYDLSSYLSIEGHYASLGEATLTPNGSIDYQVGGISALLYLRNHAANRSLRQGFSLFGRIGAGVMENESTDVVFERVNDFHLLAGAGAEYGFSNNIGVRLEAVGHDVDAIYAQLALVYRLAGNQSSKPERLSTIGVSNSSSVLAINIPNANVTKPSEILSSAVVDSDGDGVIDDEDKCNDTVAGTPIRTDGCNYFNGVVEGIVFTSDSDLLTLEARGVLGRIVNVLIKYPQAKIIIGAHTDGVGPRAENLLLSKMRAVAVTRFLVERGIDGSRIAPKAYGETKPLQSNRSAEGRAANRRVEIYLAP